QDRMVLAVAEIDHYSTDTRVTDMGVRIHFWKNTVGMIRDRPLLGVGTAGFETEYRSRVAGRTGMAGRVTADPHNQFMKIAAEQGLVGFAVFLAFLGAAAFGQHPPPPFRP